MRKPLFAAAALALTLAVSSAPTAVHAAPGAAAPVGMGTVKVQVLKDGKPVPKARLYFEHWKYADRIITTGVSGASTVKLPAGRWDGYGEIGVEQAGHPGCWDVSDGALTFSIATNQTRSLSIALGATWEYCE
jgi:hypothetical protein